jgi:hypothetical protein
MFVIIIVAVISNLYIVTVLHCLRMCLFPPLFDFFTYPLMSWFVLLGVQVPPGWESLYYNYLK